MITILWEYQVKADRIAEFEKIYAPNGAWAELFKKSQGFLGTRLIRSLDHRQFFVTIDEWESLNEYDIFLSQWKEEYEELDKQCSELTEHENCLGTFEASFNDTE